MLKYFSKKFWRTVVWAAVALIIVTAFTLILLLGVLPSLNKPPPTEAPVEPTPPIVTQTAEPSPTPSPSPKPTDSPSPTIELPSPSPTPKVLRYDIDDEFMDGDWNEWRTESDGGTVPNAEFFAAEYLVVEFSGEYDPAETRFYTQFSSDWKWNEYFTDDESVERGDRSLRFKLPDRSAITDGNAAFGFIIKGQAKITAAYFTRQTEETT